MKIYEIYEYDFVKREKGALIESFHYMKEAYTRAKKEAEAWCEDEKPKKITYFNNPNVVGFVGESDFGTIVLSKIK
jgi:hypothetical protein